MGLDVTFYRPAGPTGTGIHRYALSLRPELLTAGVDVTTPPRREIEIFGHTFGGHLSRWAWYAFGRSADGLTHAAHYHQAPRNPDILTLHDFDPWAHPGEYGLADRLHRWIVGDLSHLQALITPSHHVREQALERLDLHPEKVHAIHHGVDDQTWYPDPDPTIPQADIDILTVGEIRPRKQTHRILGTLRRMNGQSIHWHHAGPTSTSGYERTVRGRARRLERSGYWTDHGYVTDDELRQLYSSVDVLVYPSREEGYGLPPIEAAACGTPSILTPLPVFRETLGHRFEALSDRWPESDELATAIRRAADGIYDPTKLRETVRPFTWEKAARRTVDLYRRLEP
jgi:glycosyltransferase involved in cell wall biosynthesis